MGHWSHGTLESLSHGRSPICCSYAPRDGDFLYRVRQPILCSDQQLLGTPSLLIKLQSAFAECSWVATSADAESSWVATSGEAAGMGDSWRDQDTLRLKLSFPIESVAIH